MQQRIELCLPDLGFAAAGLEDVPLTLTAWYAAVGDRVTEGESLAEILAGEVVVELPSPASGHLVERCVETGAPLFVGQRLAIIVSGAVPRDASRSVWPPR
jgi:pyruvate/2-oxoglutarate dehydrogenase complex dihydrolipoamide acyltransferase (E2) component